MNADEHRFKRVEVPKDVSPGQSEPASDALGKSFQKNSQALKGRQNLQSQKTSCFPVCFFLPSPAEMPRWTRIQRAEGPKDSPGRSEWWPCVSTERRPG